MIHAHPLVCVRTCAHPLVSIIIGGGGGTVEWGGGGAVVKEGWVKPIGDSVQSVRRTRGLGMMTPTAYRATAFQGCGVKAACRCGGMADKVSGNETRPAAGKTEASGDAPGGSMWAA
jgi:hypothetical protein